MLESYIGLGGSIKSFDFRQRKSSITSTDRYNDELSQEQQRRPSNGYTNYVTNYPNEYSRRQEHSSSATRGLGPTNDIENDTNISTGIFDFPSIANSTNKEYEYGEDHDHDVHDGYGNHHDHHRNDTGEDDDDDIDFDFSSDMSFHNANSSYRFDDEVLQYSKYNLWWEMIAFGSVLVQFAPIDCNNSFLESINSLYNYSNHRKIVAEKNKLDNDLGTSRVQFHNYFLA